MALLREELTKLGQAGNWLSELSKEGLRRLADHESRIDAGKTSAEAESVIALPNENQLTAFYGEPSRDPEYLAWFNFPADYARLYTRDGAKMSDHTGDRFDDHRCHQLVAGPLEVALAEILETLGEERFVAEGWHVYGGCHNYRSKKGGSGLSTHAWGVAVDLNPVENPFFSSSCTFSAEGVEIMERHGFLWGPRAWGMPGYENPQRKGLFVDGMHFQRCLPWVVEGSYYHQHGFPQNIRSWDG